MAVKALGDSNGRAIRLGSKIGEGGEGAVYTVDGTDTVAKIYLRPMPEWQSRKLDAMTHAADADLRSVAAWPLALLFEGGKPVGFTMPRLPQSIHPLHDLTGPKTRKRLYPNANWRFLIHTGVNLARAFEVLHARQIVVGDVNSSNIVVKTDSITRLIDCDSFQLRTGSTLYPCVVGVPEYQPPELHGIDLASVERLPQHDLFGLAVIVFELLFVGRHPFAGTIKTKVADNSIEANIQAKRFFYATEARAHGLEPPPGVPTLTAMTPELARLFIAAFTGPPAQRPSASMWHTALTDLENRTEVCSVNPAHRLIKGTACPWCALERSGTTPYFIIATPTTATGDVDTSIWRTFGTNEVNQLWAQIAAIAAPPPLSSTVTPEQRYKKAPLNLWTRTRLWIAAACATVLVATFSAGYALHNGPVAFWDVIAALGVWGFIRPNAKDIARKRRDLRDSLKPQFDDTVKRWGELAEAIAFTTERTRLGKIKADLLNQRTRYDNERAQMERDREKKEREQFLDSFVIADQKIKLIGPKTAALLRSFNVETALDITPRAIMFIPTVGNARQESLLRWRHSIESRFRFDPRKGLDKTILADFEGKYSRERLNWKQQLVAGRSTLEHIRESILRERGVVQDKLRGVSHLYWQAEADSKISSLLYRC